MDVFSAAWILIGLAGMAFAALVLREALADWSAARRGQVSAPARSFLRESIRTIWFRLAVLAALVAAATAPAMFPLGQRPPWVRYVSIGLLVLGEILLTVDTGLAWRAKRRYLAAFDQEQEPDDLEGGR